MEKKIMHVSIICYTLSSLDSIYYSSRQTKAMMTVRTGYWKWLDQIHSKTFKALGSASRNDQGSRRKNDHAPGSTAKKSRAPRLREPPPFGLWRLFRVEVFAFLFLPVRRGLFAFNSPFVLTVLWSVTIASYTFGLMVKKFNRPVSSRFLFIVRQNGGPSQTNYGRDRKP